MPPGVIGGGPVPAGLRVVESATVAEAVTRAGLPGSEQIPPLQALLAWMAPKLVGKRRVSHISDLCDDEGAGLFAGLNVLPKVTYATD